MYLGIFGSLRSLLTAGSHVRGQPVTEPQTDDHVYIRGNINDRGPCPGLNSLANQGYLSRDGKNITLPQVKTALMTALHMDKALAAALSQSLKPLCRKDGTFDLLDMRRHNVIEHDASFTRLDFHQGDNYTFQLDLFQALLNDADGGPVTLKTLAKTYIRRKKESKASGAPGLPLNLWFVNLLQTVSLLNTAQTDGKLSTELMTTFYTEERFPESVLDNKRTRTLLGLIGNALGLLFHVVIGV